jgi:hypothetical protein
LKFEQSENIMPPFVMDVFLLDIMTEMLQSPLYFLSYINRRTKYLGRVLVNHELSTFSYHLTQGLWIDKENEILSIDDDFSAELDVAMMVRREGVLGEATPEGILTRFKNSPLENIIQQIESEEDPATVDFGFLLLSLSQDAINQITSTIELISARAKKDHKHHDFSIGFGSASSGITFHCNDEAVETAGPKLQNHCELRKYREKAQSWFGICINPSDEYSIRFGIYLDYSWKNSVRLNDEVKQIVQNTKKSTLEKHTQANSNLKQKRNKSKRKQQKKTRRKNRKK